MNLRLLKCLLFALLMIVSSQVSAQERAASRPSEATIREWQSRKYGMFIHFGLFSMLGGVWKGKQYSGNYSEQIQSDAHIPQNEYSALAAQFDPTRWDAEAIVRLAEQAGMKFIVLTAKHHDGFNMFATKQSTYNVVDGSPYKQDIVRSLAEACKRHGMPLGSTIQPSIGTSGTFPKKETIIRYQPHMKNSMRLN